MKPAVLRALPLAIAGAAIAAVCVVRLFGLAVPALDIFEALELLTYDARVRWAPPRARDVSRDVALIYIERDDETEFRETLQCIWPWPRIFHGELVRELAVQEARAVAFDISFPHEHPDPPGLDQYAAANNLTLDGRTEKRSDAFFAAEIARASNVVLAAFAANVRTRPVELQFPAPLFLAGAAGVGHDGLPGLDGRVGGVLRRVPAFVDIEQPQPRRVWHLGLLMGATALGIDLSRAEVEPGRIVMRDAAGRVYRVPVDRRNRLYIDWSIRPNLEQVAKAERYLQVWSGAVLRQRTHQATHAPFRNKAVLVASTDGARNIADLGATPLGASIPLSLSHLNVANSLLLGRFVRRAPVWFELLLVAALAAASAMAGWRLRIGWATAFVVVAAAGYLALAWWLYWEHRYWLPVVTPLAGALAMTHICLVSYRVVQDRTEHRRVHNLFGRLVSPNTFGLLLEKQHSALDGTRRNITVYFADLRGFTRFVEERHAHALAQGRDRGLSAAAIEALVDAAARESLATVNLYLACIADTVKAHDGTLDKYIGDCVMSFWGAPLVNQQHALACVRAAIAVHRAVHALNRQREQANLAGPGPAGAGARGEPSPLPILEVGSAINTGLISVGLIGSAANISNYTVFGREVNLASRLQRVTGPGRIIVTEATWSEVLRQAPEFADRFIPLEPVHLRDIPNPIKVYEVDWRPSPAPDAPA